MNEQTETVATAAPKVEVSNFLDKEPPEVAEAKQLALRYRLPFIDLLPPEQESPVDHDELAGLGVDAGGKELRRGRDDRVA